MIFMATQRKKPAQVYIRLFRIQIDVEQFRKPISSQIGFYSLFSFSSDLTRVILFRTHRYFPTVVFLCPFCDGSLVTFA